MILDILMMTKYTATPFIHFPFSFIESSIVVHCQITARRPVLAERGKEHDIPHSLCQPPCKVHLSQSAEGKQ